MSGVVCSARGRVLTLPSILCHHGAGEANAVCGCVRLRLSCCPVQPSAKIFAGDRALRAEAAELRLLHARKPCGDRMREGF